MATPKSAAKKTAKKRPVRTTVIKAEWERMKQDNLNLRGMVQSAQAYKKELAKNDPDKLVGVHGDVYKRSDSFQEVNAAAAEPRFKALVAVLSEEIAGNRLKVCQNADRIHGFAAFPTVEKSESEGDKFTPQSIADRLQDLIDQMRSINADLENTNNHLATLV